MILPEQSLRITQAEQLALARAKDFLSTSSRPSIYNAHQQLRFDVEWGGVRIQHTLELSGTSSVEVLAAATAWNVLFGSFRGLNPEPTSACEEQMMECGRQLADAGKQTVNGPRFSSEVGGSADCNCEEPNREVPEPDLAGSVSPRIWPSPSNASCSSSESLIIEPGQEPELASPGEQNWQQSTDTLCSSHTEMSSRWDAAVRRQLISLEMLGDDNLHSIASQLPPPNVVSFISTSRRFCSLQGWPLDLSNPVTHSNGFKTLSTQTVLQLCGNVKYNLIGCAIHGATSPTEMVRLFRECPDIRKITIKGWRHLDFPPAPRHPVLSTLAFEAPHLLSLQGLLSCPNLRRLELSGCLQLQDMAGLEHCGQLTNLAISGCKYLAAPGMKCLSQLNRLDQLSLSSCFALSSLPRLPPRLRKLSLDRCINLSGVSVALISAPQLSALAIIECSALQDLAALSDCGCLIKLNLSGCSSVLSTSLPSGLQELNLSGCRQLADLSELTSCRSLRVLRLSRCRSLSDLNSLSALPRLQELDLIELDLTAVPAAIAHCSRLNRLDMSGCAKLHDLAGLAQSPQLTQLLLRHCTSITDLTPIAALGRLEILHLSHSTQVAELRAVGSLSRLACLYINGCDRVTNVTPLAQCSALKELHAGRCSSLSSLSPLKKCKALTLIDVSYCCLLEQSTVPERPGLKVEIDWLSGPPEALAAPRTPLSTCSHTKSISLSMC